MGESDGEIEYLDEDEEIVNQCVKYANKSYDLAVKNAIPAPKPATPRNEYQKSLLSDRGRCRKRRRSSVYEEPDSDYDPANDIRIEKGIKPIKTPSRRLRGSSISTEKVRPQIQPKKVKTRSESVSSQEKDEPPKSQRRKPSEGQVTFKEEDEVDISDMIIKRREMDITIPDYDDPLCLPVRMVSRVWSDRERLKKWNNMCLRYYQRYRDLQKDVVTTTRELTFRSRRNPATDVHETSVSARVTCKDKQKHTKVEEYRGLLPNYRENKVLQFNIDEVDSDDESEDNKITTTVILSMEKNENEDCLATYKPNDAVTALYTCHTERVNKDDPTDKELRRYLNEKVVLRMCPTCYQMSNRPSTDVSDDQPIQCAVCSRNFTSAYNLIRHVKTHAKKDVLPKRHEISAILSNIMSYHYNCRICKDTCDSIVDLRRHVKQHKVSESFDCEVCSQHVTAG